MTSETSNADEILVAVEHVDSIPRSDGETRANEKTPELTLGKRTSAMSDTNAYSTSLLTRCRKHILALIAVLAVLVGGTGTASATGICDLDNSVGCEATADCIAELGGGTCIEATGGGDILQAATNTIGCMGDVFNAFGQGGELNCTANDVTVTAISDVETLDGCDAPGDTATISFVAKFEINGGVQRHDVGVYVAADGGDALSDACGLDGFCVNHPTACVADSDCPGSCSIITFPYEPDGLGDPWLDLDGSLATCSLRPTLTCEKDSDCAAGGGVKCDDPDSTGTNTCSNARAVACTTVADCDFGICTGAAVQDTCGDVSGTLDPFYWYVTNIVLECNDVDGDGNLDVNGCLSWRQPGADELCTDPLNVFPGSPSKCNCQGLPGIPVPVPGQIIVDKVTVDFNGDPLSGDATVFDFSITGPDSDLPDAFTLVDGAAHSSPGLGTSCIEGVCSGNSSLVCSLDSECNSYSVTESAEAGWEVVSESTTCVSDQGNADQDPIAGALTLNPGETLTCTFTNKRLLTPPDLTVQKDNDADLDDDFNDTEEAGGVPVTVPYQVMITNNSISDATITSIGDDTHDITGSSCAGLLNTTILAGETLTCTFDHTFTQDNQDVTRTARVPTRPQTPPGSSSQTFNRRTM
jgi:hypothetical protein